MIWRVFSSAWYFKCWDMSTLGDYDLTKKLCAVKQFWRENFGANFQNNALWFHDFFFCLILQVLGYVNAWGLSNIVHYDLTKKLCAGKQFWRENFGAKILARIFRITRYDFTSFFFCLIFQVLGYVNLTKKNCASPIKLRAKNFFKLTAQWFHDWRLYKSVHHLERSWDRSSWNNSSN